jgi:HlyD family secretion protein
MGHDRNTLEELRIDRSKARAPVRIPAWVMALVALLIVLAAGIGWWVVRPKAAIVKTMTVRETKGGTAGGRQTLLNASGYVTARREATVSSKVTGKVVEVFVEEGMKVEAGQVLARIDDSNVRAGFRLAEAQLAAARSSLNEIKVRSEEAERDLRRMTQLASEKIATAADLDHADAALKSLQARLEQQATQVTVSEREVALWQQQLDDTVVRAPFAGIVTAKNAQPGEMISPMSAGGSFTRTGICTIVDMHSLEVEVDVNESYINRVQDGQQVQATLDSYPEWRIPCKVIAIIPTADRQKATVKVRVGFEKLDPRILPHMGVKVAFQSSEDGAVATRNISIPKSTVFQRDGRDYVWLVRAGRLERRAITIAAARNDEVAIAAGVAGADTVVLNPAADFLEGMRVVEEKQ